MALDDTYKWGESTFRTLVSSAQTGGQVSIVDTVSAPGYGPPRHVHDGEDETFVIFSGRLEMEIGGERRIVGPGDTVFAPRGIEHAFHVIGDEPCHHLVILNPGGFEGFFEEMIERQLRIPEDLDQIAKAAAGHKLRFTGPPMKPTA